MAPPMLMPWIGETTGFLTDSPADAVDSGGRRLAVDVVDLDLLALAFAKANISATLSALEKGQTLTYYQSWNEYTDLSLACKASMMDGPLGATSALVLAAVELKEFKDFE